MASDATAQQLVQGWLLVYSGEKDHSSLDLSGLREMASWSQYLVTLDSVNLKLYFHGSEEARIADPGFVSDTSNAEWIGQLAAPTLATFTKTQRGSMSRFSRKSLRGSRSESLEPLPSMINLQHLEAYRTHRSLFNYEEPLRFVIALTGETRLLLRCREESLMINWLAHFRRAAAWKDRAKNTMLRELTLELDDLTRGVSGRVRAVAVYVVIYIKGIPEAVSSVKELHDTIKVNESFIFDWRRLTDHDLTTAIQLKVFLKHKDPNKHKMVAQGSLACGDSSSGNYGSTTRTAHLSKTDKLKEMRCVVKSRHHLIVVLPLSQTQPLMHWWRAEGIRHSKKVYSALENSFKLAKTATKQERLVKHYMHFISLFHAQEDGLVERWIQELVMQQLLHDSSTVGDVASHGTRNEDSSTLISAYLCFHCQHWLRDSLGDLMLAIKQAAAELGPCSVTSGVTNPVHQQRLHELFLDLFHRLYQNRGTYPLRARKFFRDLYDTAIASGVAETMSDTPLKNLLRTSARKHVFFRFLGGIVLTRPHLLGLLQSVPSSNFSTWTLRLSQALQKVMFDTSKRETEFDVSIGDFLRSHQEGRNTLLRLFAGEDPVPDEGVCAYDVLVKQSIEPAHSAALVAYDLQNVTSTLRGQSELQPLIVILTPILDHCIRVLNGNMGDTEDHLMTRRSNTSLEPSSLATSPASNALDLLATSRDFRTAMHALERLPLDGADSPDVSSAEEDISRLDTRQASRQSDVSIDTIQPTSVPPASEHSVPTAYDLLQHDKQATREARSRRYIKLRQRHQALSDQYRQLAKLNTAAVSYIDVLLDFVERQHLVPPSPLPPKSESADALEFEDDDWAELEDSSATKPKSTSSRVSACGPPTTLDPVASRLVPAARRKSSTNCKVMQPAALQRRTVTRAAQAAMVPDQLEAERHVGAPVEAAEPVEAVSEVAGKTDTSAPSNGNGSRVGQRVSSLV
eukprot:m.230933 g.230933  ORF g.230933 m.230933 type:complete len:968 (+) comp17359_c0_seq8:237-3140(+)